MTKTYQSNAHTHTLAETQSHICHVTFLKSPQHNTEILGIIIWQGYGRKTIIQVNCAKSFTQNQHCSNFRQVASGVIHGGMARRLGGRMDGSEMRKRG